MKYLRVKILKSRIRIKKYEKFQKIYKFFYINFCLKKRLKLFLITNFSCKLSKKTTKKNSKTLLVSRCFLTNRSRSITKRFNLSRSKMRELFHTSFLSGYKKSVW
jgi:ribosomal protein S14